MHPLVSYFTDAVARHAAAVDCGDKAAAEAELAKMRYALDQLRKRLKDEGLLTRDARAKERKKYGMAGARKRFQFSKR